MDAFVACGACWHPHATKARRSSVAVDGDVRDGSGPDVAMGGIDVPRLAGLDAPDGVVGVSRLEPVDVLEAVDTQPADDTTAVISARGRAGYDVDAAALGGDTNRRANRHFTQVNRVGFGGHASPLFSRYNSQTTTSYYSILLIKNQLSDYVQQWYNSPMNDQLYDDVALERQIKEKFGVSAEVESVIARQIPVGRSVEATLFLTNKKQLFLYVDGEAPLLLSDVKKIVSRVGLNAEMYMPPKGQPLYFDEIGTAKFEEIFPGRKVTNESDVAFYKTLAPYNPALILIREVKNGIIYQYDSDAADSWRAHARFSYRRIMTS